MNASEKELNNTSTGIGRPAAVTQKWTVTLRFSVPTERGLLLTNEAKGILVNAITGSNVVVGHGAGYVVVTLTTQAPDHRTASDIATVAADEGLRAAKLPTLRVVDCRAVQTSDIESRDLSVPDLVGVSEIAEMLDMSKQRAWQVSRTQQFPAQVCQLKSGPLWRRSDVIDARKRRQKDL